MRETNDVMSPTHAPQVCGCGCGVFVGVTCGVGAGAVVAGGSRVAVQGETGCERACGDGVCSYVGTFLYSPLAAPCSTHKCHLSMEER